MAARIVSHHLKQPVVATRERRGETNRRTPAADRAPAESIIEAMADESVMTATAREPR